MVRVWYQSNNAVKGALSASEYLELIEVDEIEPVEDLWFGENYCLMFMEPIENKDGSVTYRHPRIHLDINDIRSICMKCGNAVDCCVC